MRRWVLTAEKAQDKRRRKAGLGGSGEGECRTAQTPGVTTLVLTGKGDMEGTTLATLKTGTTVAF